MFIGNNSVTVSGNINVQAESAGFMDPVEEALYNVAVDEANYNNILGCLAIAEVTAAHNGLDPNSVYTEGTVSDFWEKIKEFFKKLWAKIKGLWAKLVATFDQHAKSGKEFFDKYKRTLTDKFTKIDRDKVKFSGYKFSDITNLNTNTIETHLTINTLFNGYVKKENGKDKIDMPDDDAITEKEDKFRGFLVDFINGGNATPDNATNSYTLKEMVKEIHDNLRDGGTKDNDLDITYQYIATVLSNSDKAKRTFEKVYNAFERAMNTNIRAIEREQDNKIKDSANNPDDDYKNKTVTLYSKLIRYVKTCFSSAQAAAAELFKALKDEISQAKGFAAQVLRAGVRDGFKEGANLSGNSVFGMVNLV